MMIERQTGCIRPSKTLQINAKDSLEHIVSLQLGENQTVSAMQTGWTWLTAKNVYVDGAYFIFSFGFYENTLKQIELVRSKERFDLAANWQTWSEAVERKILAELHIWIRTELGREGAFDWGEARANYDPKSGSSSIIIRYK